MKKISVFCFVYFSILISCIGQSTDSAVVTNIFKLNFFSPGASYESKVSKTKTIYFEASINTLLALGSRDVFFFTGPAFHLHLRNYYNYRQRNKQNLRTSLNSMNYLAPMLFASVDWENEFIGIGGFVWGLQRNYGKRFALDVYAGLGYGFGSDSYMNGLQPITQIKLGFWLNRKKQ